jgi:hypothetical protein
MLVENRECLHCVGVTRHEMVEKVERGLVWTLVICQTCGSTRRQHVRAANEQIQPAAPGV